VKKLERSNSSKEKRKRKREECRNIVASFREVSQVKEGAGAFKSCDSSSKQTPRLLSHGEDI